LKDVLAARSAPVARRVAVGEGVREMQARVKARATPQAKFCWHCSKPLQARTAQCPFCGELQ
jgi:hypothetical protein